jgi:hypothetical protein
MIKDIITPFPLDFASNVKLPSYEPEAWHSTFTVWNKCNIANFHQFLAESSVDELLDRFFNVII